MHQHHGPCESLWSVHLQVAHDLYIIIESSRQMAAQQKIFIVWLQGQPGWIVDRYHAYTQRVVPKSSQMIYFACIDRAD